MRPTRWSCLWILCLVWPLLSGCITDEMAIESTLKRNFHISAGNTSHVFSKESSRYNQNPPLDWDLDSILEKQSVAHYDPFEKYSKQTYFRDGGLITRHFYLMPGRGAPIAELLCSYVGGLQLLPNVPMNTITDAHFKNNVVAVVPSVMTDKRPSAHKTYQGFSMLNHQTGVVADMMIVTVDSQKRLMEIDNCLTNLLTELPQISVKVKVMEISVNDSWEWGNENIISRVTGSTKGFLKEWFNFYNTQTMINNLGNIDDFQGSLFNAFGVHDKFQLDATFELLQRVTDSDVLTAPTITVLNGHSAVIETGDRIPKQEIVTNATSSYFNTKYEQIGVKLIVVPYLLPDGVIQLDINVEVVALTGREPFATASGVLSQPILSNRYASTRVLIKEGSAFAMGGLMSTAEYEVISKLPFLGDIPILGYLFKSKNIEKRQSQIIFSIEPRVVRREDSWTKKDDN